MMKFKQISPDAVLKSTSNMDFNKVTLIKVGIAIVVIILAHVIATMLSKLAVHIVNDQNKKQEDRAILYSIVDKAVYWTIMLVVLFLLPSFIGIETAAVVAVFGSILFAIGLGLQGTLADLATGVMLLAANTFRLNDYIHISDPKIIGRVKSFGILYTSIVDAETGAIITVPNRVLYEKVISNHSSVKQQVALLEFVVANSNKDLTKTLHKLRDDLQKRHDVLQLPEPYRVTVEVDKILAYGTVIEVRLPLSASDFQLTGTINKQSELMTFIRERLEEYGVELVDLSKGMHLITRSGADAPVPPQYKTTMPYPRFLSS